MHKVIASFMSKHVYVFNDTTFENYHNCEIVDE